MDKMRTYQEHRLEIFGTPLSGQGFVQFKYMMPEEALTLATEEALERGLLTKLEIGTR